MPKQLPDDLWEVQRFARATIDALSAHICVLDAQGVILVVNKAWRDFALANPPVQGNVNEGAHYLAICDAATGPWSEEAAPFAAGIRAVLNGHAEEFSLEYPCHYGDQKRWFNGRVTRFPEGGPRRVVVAHENVTGRKLAELALQEAKDHLEIEVELRTANLTQARQELIRSVEQLSALTAELNLSEERERRLIAEALHDKVVQNLALGAMKLDQALKKGLLPQDEVIGNLQEILATSMQDLRNLCIDLSPPILYDLGLHAAINSLGRRLAKEYGFNFVLQGGEDEPLLRDEIKIALFQMARELLVNAVKHAGADRVTAQLWHDTGTVGVVITDNGAGFDPSSVAPGFGLANIKQRTEYLQGTLSVSSAAGRGSQIEITIPLSA